MTQFYVKQMLDSGMFEKVELKDWKRKDPANKTFDDATDCFEEIISENETYESHAGGTTKRSEFEIAMQVKDAKRPDADTGDDIHNYIKDLATYSSAGKEIIQQMQQTSSIMVSLNMQM